MTITALALTTSLLVAAPPPVVYDHQHQINVQLLEAHYVQSAVCMRRATLVMLNQGVRDPKVLDAFNLGSCSGALYRHLVGPMSWKPEDVMLLLHRMSDLSIAHSTQQN